MKILQSFASFDVNYSTLHLLISYPPFVVACLNLKSGDVRMGTSGALLMLLQHTLLIIQNKYYCLALYKAGVLCKLEFNLSMPYTAQT